MLKKKYWSNKKILAEKAQYNILLSQRSTGKSYATKTYILKNAYESSKMFIYLRRYSMDSKPSNVESYFGDIPIDTITNGEYDCIIGIAGKIYFGKYGDDLKPKKGKLIGYYTALSAYEHYKSLTYPDVNDVVYEEFITDNGYLPNEVSKLMNFISTVFRDKTGSVWLIGNTISRYCPYFTEWGLNKIAKQKPGTIDIYKYKSKDIEGNEITTNIAVEFCANPGSDSKMFFGTIGENVKGTGQIWEIKEMPHMPEGDYTMLYELLIRDSGFSFVVQLMVGDNGGLFLYAYPFTGNRRIQRIIQKDFSPDPFISNKFLDKINAEVIMRKCLNENKICFSDNLCGCDFEQVMTNWGGSI